MIVSQLDICNCHMISERLLAIHPASPSWLSGTDHAGPGRDIAAFSDQLIRAPRTRMIGSVAEFSAPRRAASGLAAGPCPGVVGPARRTDLEEAMHKERGHVPKQRDRVFRVIGVHWQRYHHIC